MLFASTVAAFAVLASTVSAQTFFKCNPMKEDCPIDPALGMAFNQTFSSSSKLDKKLWNITAKAPKFSDEGMVFTLNEKGESVNVQSQFYIFWGTYEVIMKVSPGQGLISTSVLLSDTLDEIDWEVIGSDKKQVETNYYGKGVQNQTNAAYYPTQIPAQDEFHNYTVHWTQEKTEWIYDGKVVRSMAFGEALENGLFYPQTPCHVNLGLWSAGDSNQTGTVEWAGGKTDWSKGPYTMTVKSIRVVDGTQNATSYSYGDKTGSFKSIQVKKEGKSKQAETISKPPSKTVSEQYQGMSQGAKIAIIAAPLGVVALAILIGCFCCVKQRKLGRRERAIEDAQWEKENAEMLAYRRKMATGGFSQGSAYQPAPTSSPRPF